MGSPKLFPGSKTFASPAPTSHPAVAPVRWTTVTAHPVIRSGGGANAIGWGAVTTMPTPSDENLRGLLAQAELDLAEANQRRDQQARIVSNLLPSTDTRAYAENILREIDLTIAFISANQDLLQHILD